MVKSRIGFVCLPCETGPSDYFSKNRVAYFCSSPTSMVSGAETMSSFGRGKGGIGQRLASLGWGRVVEMTSYLDCLLLTAAVRDTLTRLFHGFSGPQCAQVHSLSDLHLRKSGVDNHAMWEPADGRDSLGEIRDASLGAARITREKPDASTSLTSARKVDRETTCRGEVLRI
jgi:hypothetical protein